MLKQLKIYYVFVSMPFIAVLLGSAIFYGAIKSTIDTNPHPQINFIIFFIILSGGALILFNARRLMREAKALTEFAGAIHAKTDLTTLQEMADKYDCDIACLLQMIATSGERSISHQEQAALEHELANVNSTLNRRNSLPQYLTGLLVGMGLLGTFIGLLATLGDITALISSFADLDMSKADPIAVFRNMIEKMKAPMSSMAIAFSASMFGLLGSIILGLMMVGIRRLQGDVFSVLSSEIARHIEMALSFESISFGNGGVSTGDLSADILLRIEKRMAESARMQQRAPSSEMDDFKKQHADMLRVLTEDAEASNNFRSELQKLGSQLSSQLGTISDNIGKDNREIASQISELAAHMSSDAKETHKLLAMQLDEQKGLKDTLDSYKIEERLIESSRVQQRALSSQLDDFKKQRADMLRTLTEQNEASNNFRSELQCVGRQLGDITNIMEEGNSEVSTQISELIVHISGDAKETQKLLSNAGNFRVELQQLATQIGTLSNVMENGNSELTKQISEMTVHLDGEAKDSHEQRAQMLGRLIEQIEASNQYRSELNELGGHLGSIFNLVEKGSADITVQIAELMNHMAADAKETHKLLTMQMDGKL